MRLPLGSRTTNARPLYSDFRIDQKHPQANSPRNDRLDRNWDLNLGTFDSDSDSVCPCSCQGPGASVSTQLGVKLPLTLVDVLLCDRCLPTPTSALSERCDTQLQDTLTVALRSLCYGAGAGAGGGKPSLFTVGFTALQHPLGRPMACDSYWLPPRHVCGPFFNSLVLSCLLGLCRVCPYW